MTVVVCGYQSWWFSGGFVPSTVLLGVGIAEEGWSVKAMRDCTFAVLTIALGDTLPFSCSVSSFFA